MPEDKKIEEQNNKESDFADEAKEVSIPAPEIKPEAKTDQAAVVDLHLTATESISENPEEKKPDKKAPKAKAEAVKYVYDDPDLQGMENSRLDFFKVYHQSNVVKWVVAGVSLILIILGWLLPTYMIKDTNVAFYVTISVVVVALGIMLGFNAYYKRKVDKAMKKYFSDYYMYNNHYVFQGIAENITGGVDDKLDPAIFKKANIYKDLVKVGSRETLSFAYHGHEILFSDAAATVKGERSAKTVFVGKFLKTDNHYKGSELVIYFKGNNRALPPTNLAGREIFSDTRTMVVYGSGDAKRFLTHDVKTALAAFSTNATFVDMAISVQEGATFVAMGYEDDLMVLPLEKPFNPAPTKQLKENLNEVFALLDAIDASESHT